jgi:elongation factor P
MVFVVQYEIVVYLLRLSGKDDCAAEDDQETGGESKNGEKAFHNRMVSRISQELTNFRFSSKLGASYIDTWTGEPRPYRIKNPMASTSEIKKGVVIRDPQGLWVVNEFQHVNPGKGAAFVRTRIKNIQTGKVLEVTYKTSESVDLVDVEHRRMQYLYHDATGYTFMDQGTYEQMTMSDEDVGEQGKYLREGMEVNMSTFEGRAIALELPRKMTFKVVTTMDAVAGNTASGNVQKDAELEGGIMTRVPLFIKEGEEVIINTETGEYVERA